jgi:glycerate 2-kinase
VSASSARERLTAIARAALAAVEPRACVERVLAAHPIEGPVVVLALGKASVGMTEGAVRACDVRGGLVIAPVGAGRGSLSPAIDVVHGAHPIPDAQVTVRGEALLARAAQIPERQHALVLLSGGGSALADALVPGVSTDELRAMTDALLRAGATIEELNTMRASLSRLKGGGLARALSVASTTLVVSDVPGFPPSLVASGPMSPLPSDALERALAKPHVASAVPDRLRARARLAPGSSAPLLVAADNDTAVEAALGAARALGLEAVRGRPLIGEARERGAALAEETRRTSADALVLGGETTVTVRGRGRGGRSHELALGALEAGITGSLLAFGTDGVDGTSDAAGAFVDESLRSALSSSPISPASALAENDAHRFFWALDAQLVTGPTGTNVADVVIWLR